MTTPQYEFAPGEPTPWDSGIVMGAMSDNPHASDADDTTPIEPRWALPVQVVLALGVLMSWMTMLSYALTSDGGAALRAAGVGLVFVASTPIALRLIDRHTR